ncbi:MAG: hypothetical protein HGA44_18905 [Cellulomonadaceae bacterium]|nr:hypothetical protein [Cellulomonadaceae bacterium]
MVTLKVSAVPAWMSDIVEVQPPPWAAAREPGDDGDEERNETDADEATVDREVRVISPMLDVLGGHDLFRVGSEMSDRQRGAVMGTGRRGGPVTAIGGAVGDALELADNGHPIGVERDTDLRELSAITTFDDVRLGGDTMVGKGDRERSELGVAGQEQGPSHRGLQSEDDRQRRAHPNDEAATGRPERPSRRREVRPCALACDVFAYAHRLSPRGDS